MTPYQSFLFFFILFLLATYWGRRDSASGRRDIRRITGYGVAFCVLGLNLWFVTRFEDVLNSFPSSHQASVFATPWLWVSALCVGVTLLLISFFSRKSRQHAA
jgi:cytochrome bd-type quinol oxidase subunit 2